MNKLVFCCFFIATIGSVFCQNRVPPPAGLPPYPVQGATWNLNDPTHPCNQPGANCNNQLNSRFAEESSYIDHRGNRERYTRVCDDRGCYERRVSSGQSRLSLSFWLFGFLAILTGVKNVFH